MNHGYIIENNIVDLYLTGNLTTEESEQFELHFVDCQTCLDQLELGRAFKHGLRLIHDDSVWDKGRARAVGPFGWLAQFNTSRQIAILIISLALLLIPITLLVIRVARLQGELGQVKSSVASGEESAGDQVGSKGGAAHADNQSDEQSSVLKGDQATAQIEQQSRKKEVTPVQARPQINTSVFVLSSVRGAPSKGQTPINEFFVPQGSGSFILSVELEEEPEYKNYHVAVTGRGGRVIWQTSNLIPDEHKSLVIVFPGDFFREGIYKLNLNGVNQDGKHQSLSEYVFRITRKKSP